MNAGQILLYLIIAVVVLQLLRKVILIKSIKHYSPVELFRKLKDSKAVILLDVRTARERKAQAIKNSIHIPLAEINSRVVELKKYQNQEIVCYCRSGNRSLSAASKLKKNGFNAANLRGGILQWNSTGLK